MINQAEKLSIAFTAAVFCVSSVYTSSYENVNKISIDEISNAFGDSKSNKNSIILETNFDDYKFFLSNTLQSAIENAAQRYKLINKHEFSFNEQTNQFIKILYKINPFSEMKINFRDDALKATMNYDNREISLKYDYDCPEILFVSCFDSDKTLKIEEFSFDSFESLADFR